LQREKYRGINIGKTTKKEKTMQDDLKVKIADLEQRLHHMWGYL
jgi:hypothetical protein